MRLSIHRNFPSRPEASSCAGFSLAELAVVVSIISIMIAVALPISRHLIISARSAAVINDLRVFSSAFQAYANEHGDWPDGDGAPGVFPAGMGSYLGQTNWQHRTPIGGNYAWDPNSTQQGSRYRAAIVIVPSDANPLVLDRAQLLDLDSKLDDGNLATGNFLLGYDDNPVFVLEH